MTQEEFDALVARLEEHSRRNPKGYKRKVVLLALSANFYLAFILLFLFALFVGACVSVIVLKFWGIKIALFIGGIIFVVLKSFKIEQGAPEGLLIEPEESPALFAMIASLRRELKAPRFHKVLITGELNAAVQQIPRLGALGWHRNYLSIGLPLMKLLTVDQFKAVLAHEFGHLARAHGALSNWIYRQRLRWANLVQAMEGKQSRGSFLFKPFFEWFVPYFSAYSFPLARMNEYEADQTAVRLTSPVIAAEALAGTHVVASYLHERYWPDVHKKADDHPAPNFAPYSGITEGVAGHVDKDITQAWLERAMSQATTSADTHPSLKDRLGAIGAEPMIHFPEPEQAADRLLGSALPVVENYFDQKWQKQIAPAWEKRYKEVQDGRNRLAELNAMQDPLELNEAYERAWLTESYTDDVEGAMAQFVALQEQYPDSALASFHLGIRLLAKDDESGVALLIRAMELDHHATVRACEALRNYFWRKGDSELAQEWHTKMYEREQIEQAAAHERSHVATSDFFEPHGLSAEAIASLRAQLQQIAELREVWLVRKRMRHFPESPCYVLGFVVTPWYRKYDELKTLTARRTLVEHLAFPGEALILTLEGPNVRIGRAIKKVDGARIL